MNNNKVIGQRINSALAKNHIKQKELATELGIPDNTISYFVSGKRTPNTDQIIKISRKLNVSADYLLGLSKIETPQIEVQEVNNRYGLSESALQNLEKITVLAHLHEKHQQLTDGIMKFERTLKNTRNDNPTKEYIVEILREQDKLKIERDTLETEMLELTDPGEGYLKPPKWLAPIRCQQAWQKLHSIVALLTLKHGEKTLDEVGQYLYMGKIKKGIGDIIGTSNETLLITEEDIAKIKIFNVQETLVKMREELNKEESVSDKEVLSKVR